MVLRGKSIYLIGIGGCGMSGLARMLQHAGAQCTGSDSTPSELTESLARTGIPVSHDQANGQLPDSCDLVIASAAIPPDHPELLSAQARGLSVVSYAEALGILQALKTGISIAGTHGKSTTASMLAYILIETGLDPSVVVGATCPQLGGGSRTGAAIVPGNGPYADRPGYLIAEACEFNRSFHHHRPMIALINNVEADHLDIYGSLDEIVGAFAEFAQLIPARKDGGRLLLAHDEAHRRVISAGLQCHIATFGFNPAADYVIQYDIDSQTVTLQHEAQTVTSWSLRVHGEHMAKNSAAAAILAQWCGAEWNKIGQALSEFRGLDRRMQYLGQRDVPGGKVAVYDDYGHHPTEIDATLRALRQSVPHERLICVFQPHQHSRTRFLLNEFAESFTHADVVIVPHIYFVRDSELEKMRVSAADLVDRLRRKGVMAMHLYPFEAIVEQLEVICRPNDLLVIMGAGPVWKVGRDFLKSHQADEA